MFKNILLTVDLSHKEEHSLAAEMAGKHISSDSNLYVVSVIPPIDGGGFVSSFLPANYDEELIEKAKEELHKFTAEHLPNVKDIKHIVVHGRIYESIIDIAGQLDINLIVTLASNAKGKKHTSFGPNVARIARNSNCSVLVLR